ncbi:hypothetical protein KAR91_11250 [Candidatus Pacearchaeota archaeon]|nr:hypothetical protein [Candidatus Pacearchaeota archaeon]
MNKKTQMDIVYSIVRFNQPVRTDQVKILAMPGGVSCADRFLRWLRDDGFIKGEKLEKDNTKTWTLTDKEYVKRKSSVPGVSIKTDSSGQLGMALVVMCFFMSLFLFCSVPAYADFSSGKEMTKSFEGWRSDVYQDPGGNLSIGYGFNIDEVFVQSLLPAGVLSGRTTLKVEFADNVFDVLYKNAKKSTIRFLGKKAFQKLSTQQKYILIDMAYNLGHGRFSKFKKMRAAILDGDYSRASFEIKNSRWYTQTGRRGRHHVKYFRLGVVNG